MTRMKMENPVIETAINWARIDEVAKESRPLHSLENLLTKNKINPRCIYASVNVGEAWTVREFTLMWLIFIKHVEAKTAVAYVRAAYGVDRGHWEIHSPSSIVCDIYYALTSEERVCTEIVKLVDYMFN